MKFILTLTLLTPCALGICQNADTVQTRILDEVVVAGVRTEGDTLQNFYRSNPSATTEGILSRMKGVSLIRRGAFGQEPVFRGLSNGQLNVTIDGMKMFGACTDRMDPVTIYVEPSNLSVIQSQTGPQGSEFGSTIGGSLNMKLAQPSVGDNKTSVVIGTGVQSSPPALNVYATVHSSHKTAGYRASLVFRKANNYRQGGGQEVFYSQYQKANVSLAGKWALARYDTLSADVLLDRGVNIGFPALAMDVGYAQAGIFSLTYRHVVPWFIVQNIKIKAYHNSIAHSMDDTRRPDVPMHMDMPGRSSTSGIYADGEIHIFHQHQTFAKVDYFRNDLLGEMTMYPPEGQPMYMQTAAKSYRQDAGFYLAQQYRLNARNKFLLTLRTDYVQDVLHAGIGRDQLAVLYAGDFSRTTTLLKSFSLNYRKTFSPAWMVELNTGYGERMPTLNERFGFYLYNKFDGYDYIGSPYLNPETSTNAELSLNYLGPLVEVQASAFYQSIADYIMGNVTSGMSTMTIGARGVKQFVHAGHARLRGFDLMILANPLPPLQWITTIKYTYGSLAGSDAIPLIPPFKSVSSLRYKRGHFEVQGEWETALAQNHVSAAAGEQRTPAYNIINLRAAIKAGTRWKIAYGIENLFDKQYREHLDWGNIMRPGRNIYLNLSFNF